MSRYRDDLRAARLRTAALEEELDEHEAQLAAQDEHIATLKEQLADRDDQLARVDHEPDERAELTERDVISGDGRRMKLQRLEPRSSSSIVTILALVIMAIAIIGIFSLMVRM